MKHRRLVRSVFLGLLFLCVIAWGWSYPYREHLAYNGVHSQDWVIELGGGAVFLGRHWGYMDPPGWDYYHIGKDPHAGDLRGAGFSLLGFQFFTSPAPPALAGMGSFVIVPFWFLTTLLALALILVWRKTRKAKPGRCPKCGYDLRGQKPGDHCPECGTLWPFQP
ncbi:MAG: hypothetical protein WD042_05560 [Phycisphaeraceae bacterium]